MPFIKIGTLGQLPPDSMMEVSIGEDLYAVCNVEGEIRALSGICLHQGAPLAQGNVIDGRIVCPWHAWEFDCRTGENCADPDQRLMTYPTKIEGGDIFLQVP